MYVSLKYFSENILKHNTNTFGHYPSSQQIFVILSYATSSFNLYKNTTTKGIQVQERIRYH